MSTRFIDHPTLGYDYVKCPYTGEVVNPGTRKKIVCFKCRQNILVASEIETWITYPATLKRRKRIVDQPYAVYRHKRFVLYHVNCVPDATIAEDYSDNESSSIEDSWVPELD